MRTVATVIGSALRWDTIRGSCTHLIPRELNGHPSQGLSKNQSSAARVAEDAVRTGILSLIMSL